MNNKTAEQQVVATKTFVDFVKEYKTKSNAIRTWTAEGLTRSSIVLRFKNEFGMHVIYQHVRNVQLMPLKGKQE